MANNRVFYAVHAVGFKEDGVAGVVPTGRELHGAQSVSVDTNFNLEQIFELGQIEIYENYENKPEIQMTVEKALDGRPLIYHLATAGSTGPTLVARTTQKTIGVLGIWSDTYSSASGTPEKFVTCSGLYIQSLNYSLPVDGNCTESVTFVGSDKVWTTGDAFEYDYINTDESSASGMQRRENVIMGEGAICSLFPTDIPGITSSGTNKLNANGTAYSAHIQNVTIATDLGREDMYELGRKIEYYRFVNFPVKVTTTIEYMANEGGDNVNAHADTDNLSDQTIKIRLDDNTQFYMGTKNKLESVSYSGGDTGGGSVTVSMTYAGNNTLTITNPTTDPDTHAHV
jgi:hypothetical protein